MPTKGKKDMRMLILEKSLLSSALLIVFYFSQPQYGVIIMILILQRKTVNEGLKIT